MSEQDYPDPFDQPIEPATLASVAETLIRLQAAKARVYGDSWKKHGELVSIFANISRKYDRLEQTRGTTLATPDETLLDTLGDLAVYCGLYRTWLFDGDPTFPSDMRFLARHASKGIFPIQTPTRGWELIQTAYASLEKLLLQPPIPPSSAFTTKGHYAGIMVRAAMELLVDASYQTPDAYARWADQWK